METPIRVVIADDNADMRRIERMMISRAEGFEIVGEAEDGVQLLKDVSFIVTKGQKIALVGSNEQAQTALFRILAEEIKPDSGSFKWGLSTSRSYFPADNSAFFA